MKTILCKGDLVKHAPLESNRKELKAVYADFGHSPDYSLGLVLRVKKDFSLVLPTSPQTKKPAWYENNELVVISRG